MIRIRNRSWRLLPSLFLGGALLGGVFFGSPCQPTNAADDASDNISVLEQQVQQHIRDLANPSYAVRVRARAELESLGLLALDAIRDAEESTDTEIAFAARFLMSSMQIEWAKETDPAPVRSLLQGYEDFNSTDRESAMGRLASLPNWQGLVPLTRLARFEPNLRLSRHAALLAIRYDRQSGDPNLNVIRQVETAIGDSRREAADWVRQYCGDVVDKTYSTDDWREMIAAERSLIDVGSNNTRTSPQTLLELYRVCATRAVNASQREEALRLATEGLDKVLSRRQDLLDAVSWALDTNLYEIVFELRNREPQRFADEAELMYGVAEAYMISGDQQRSTNFSIAALEINALPELNPEAKSGVTADDLESLAARHREIGHNLEMRGRFDWAEAEYRHVIDRMPVDSAIAAVIRSQLALMLGSLNEHQKVVDVLQPLVDRMEKDSVFRARIEQKVWISYSQIASKLKYHQGLAGTDEEARQALLNAYRLDPVNVDILIAMHQQAGDEKWRKMVDDEIETVVARWNRKIVSLENSIKLNNSLETKLDLALACNQNAWLIANTDGDHELAIKYGKRAVELSPNESAYLDTLARCYFESGDIDQAIIYQQMAIGIDPHLPPLKRQLEMFFEAKKGDDNTSEDSK